MNDWAGLKVFSLESFRNATPRSQSKPDSCLETIGSLRWMEEGSSLQAAMGKFLAWTFLCLNPSESCLKRCT